MKCNQLFSHSRPSFPKAAPAAAQPARPSCGRSSTQNNPLDITLLSLPPAGAAAAVGPTITSERREARTIHQSYASALIRVCSPNLDPPLRGHPAARRPGALGGGPHNHRGGAAPHIQTWMRGRVGSTTPQHDALAHSAADHVTAEVSGARTWSAAPRWMSSEAGGAPLPAEEAMLSTS